MNTTMNIFMKRICHNLVKTCHLLQHLKLKLPYQLSKLFWKPHQDFLSHLTQLQTVSTIFKLLMLLKLSSHFWMKKFTIMSKKHIIVNFIIQKLKSKHTTLKKYTNRNDKIHNYVKKNIIVNFIIQKLKSKHISLKKYTNWAKCKSCD